MRKQESVWVEFVVPLLVMIIIIALFALTNDPVELPDSQRVGPDVGFWETADQYHNRKAQEEVARRQMLAVEAISKRTE
jgi:hypothetical protein